MKRPDILILGGGIIGCALALELAEENLSVTVVEKAEPGREASWAAAAMLAPGAEHEEHPTMVKLARASADLYPGWVAKLAARTSLDLGYRSKGTLLVAFNEEEAARLAPTRPVRGQVVALRREQPLLRHVVRSARAYLVPRADGRLVVGNTMEDAGYDKSVTASVLRRLLTAAREIVPAAAAMLFAGAWVGLRPDTPDQLPILGATDVENFFVATGHFRNGILLGPVTARLLTELILGRPASLPLEPFSPLRFAAK